MATIPYSPQHWNFANMNSPADLHCEFGKPTALLREYDRSKNGHCLLGKALLSTESAAISARVESMEEGAGIGFYLGLGSWTDYVMLAAKPEGISLRIPSGVPLGDTFRGKGTRPFYTLFSLARPPQCPFTLGLALRGGGFHVSLNGETLFTLPTGAVPFWAGLAAQRPPRFFAKALCEAEGKRKADARFGAFGAEGLLPGETLTGLCRLPGGAPAPGASVHLAGYPDFWAQTGPDGGFTMPGVPRGTYRLVAGIPGGAFHTQTVRWRGVPLEVCTGERDPLARAIPALPLQSPCPKQNLNGLWAFGFGPGDKACTTLPAEAAGYTDRCIRVPYPWTSLAAFGEEALADDNSLYQAASFLCNGRETGHTAWYRRTVALEAHRNAAPWLCFGGVSGAARVWLDGVWLGDIVDAWNVFAFPLPGFGAGAHSLTVCVWSAAESRDTCTGKQGFWFTQAPGLWQGAWVEYRPALHIAEILCRHPAPGGAALPLELEATLAPGGPDWQSLAPQKTAGGWQWQLHCPREGWYYQRLRYSAAAGGEARLSCGAPAHCTAPTQSITLPLEATGAPTLWDSAGFWMHLPAGAHRCRLATTGTETGGSIDIQAVQLTAAALPDTVAFTLDGQTARGTPQITPDGRAVATAVIPLESPRLWAPEDPWRYTVAATAVAQLGPAGQAVTATAARRLGLRHFTTRPLPGGPKGAKHFALNGKPLYLRGVLDQGYNPWGLISYPATGGRPGGMAFDIAAARACGYNLMRMHIKDNEPEWYTQCDEQGMLVWDELPVNFYARADDAVWRGMYLRQLRATLTKHNYHPSVVLFSTFNESWGIMGDHEQSPWAWPGGQALIRRAARLYKKQGTALVVDNSGYGKTAETQVIDHHCYPIGHADARSFWQRLAAQNHPGACFNFYNEENRALMQRPEIRGLLQRNSAIDLAKTNYLGGDRQTGQPVVISEFVHTDGQEQMLRIFPAFGGYTRMNLASQENEDTSPLTATRRWRDFGYLHADFTPTGYRRMNSPDLLYPDCPRLVFAPPGGEVALPLYCAPWSEAARKGPLRVAWVLHGISAEGLPRLGLAKGGWDIQPAPYLPSPCGTLRCTLPPGMAGGWLFTQLWAGHSLLAENQTRVVAKNCPLPAPPAVAWPPEIKGEGPTGIVQGENCRLAWAWGSSEWRLAFPAPPPFGHSKPGGGQTPAAGYTPTALVFEASACECMDGTRVTDKTTHPGSCTVLLEGEEIAHFTLPDHPCDERAIFSDAAGVAAGDEFRYESSGRWGYGYKCVAPLTPAQLARLQKGAALCLRAGPGGLVLYGRGTGRYGCDPLLLPAAKINRNELKHYEAR